MLQFKINRFITLKLENGKTNIYINNELFNQCKYILMRKNVNDLEDLLEIESVDELAQRSIDDLAEDLDHSLENIDIPAKVRFWVHCSNLQVWTENNYDTRLIHSNLAFPLLKKLTEVGDLNAIKVFKHEILKRFLEGGSTTKEFLIQEKYFDYLSEEEIRSILPINDQLLLEDLEQILQIKFSLARDLESITGIEGNKPRNLYYLDKFEDPKIIGMRILKLDIDRIPESISKFKDLKYLVLSHNYSKYIPDSMGNLKKLEHLDLALNHFKKLPDSFRKLKSLRELDLWSNKLNVMPNVIRDIKSLERLYLQGNPIDEFPNMFGKLRKNNKDNNYFKL